MELGSALGTEELELRELEQLSLWRKVCLAWLEAGTRVSQSAKLTLESTEQEVLFEQLEGVLACA